MDFATTGTGIAAATGSGNASLLVNLLGHLAGVLVFGIFLFLILRDRAARRLQGSAKSMLAAGLALAWNVASLVVLLVANSAQAAAGVGVIAWTAALGFSVLSLLPAVLFNLSLLDLSHVDLTQVVSSPVDRARQDRYRLLVAAGYVLSGIAICFHLAELFAGPDLSQDRYHLWGLVLISAGFGGLTVLAAVLEARRGPGQAGPSRPRSATRAGISRLVGAMSMFLLAVSFVHFGSGHGDVTEVWSQELAFHHAAIPLALLILLQDYRFVLVDAFVRFLANGILAAAFAGAWYQVQRLLPQAGVATAGALGIAAQILVGCVFLILFAVGRTRLQAALSQMVFRSSDLEAAIRAMKPPHGDEDEYLRATAARLGATLGSAAEVVPNAAWDALDLRQPTLAAELPRTEEQRAGDQAQAIVPLRFASGNRMYFVLGRRSGGRRYLSEDLAALGRAAGLVVEQVERVRESETRRLAAQAELRALQAQIHPHFLFNALNTLYGTIPREATGARETVLNLAEIFRYFLETRRAFLPLEQELRIVRAYLEVERLRLGDKLRVEIDVSDEALQVPIPVLSLEPLVENAVKHGIAPKVGGGVVRIQARVTGALGEAGNGDRGLRALEVTVSDTGVGFTSRKAHGSSGSGARSTDSDVMGSEGVGLENVARRLELCYGPGSTLEIESTGGGAVVSFRIPLAPLADRALVEEIRT